MSGPIVEFGTGVQDHGAWANAYEPIRHPAPLVIGLRVEGNRMSIGPVTDSGVTFMTEHRAWFDGLSTEIRDRFLYATMRVEKERRGEWSRDIVQPPDGLLDLINTRLRFAFGPLVQCGVARVVA